MNSMAAVACVISFQAFMSVDVEVLMEVNMAANVSSCVWMLGALWGLGQDADTRKQRRKWNHTSCRPLGLRERFDSSPPTPLNNAELFSSCHADLSDFQSLRLIIPWSVLTSKESGGAWSQKTTKLQQFQRALGTIIPEYSKKCAVSATS